MKKQNLRQKTYLIVQKPIPLLLKNYKKLKNIWKIQEHQGEKSSFSRTIQETDEIQEQFKEFKKFKGRVATLQ